jgi:hypothetical protein
MLTILFQQHDRPLKVYTSFVICSRNLGYWCEGTNLLKLVDFKRRAKLFEAESCGISRSLTGFKKSSEGINRACVAKTFI